MAIPAHLANLALFSAPGPVYLSNPAPLAIHQDLLAHLASLALLFSATCVKMKAANALSAMS